MDKWIFEELQTVGIHILEANCVIQLRSIISGALSVIGLKYEILGRYAICQLAKVDSHVLIVYGCTSLYMSCTPSFMCSIIQHCHQPPLLQLLHYTITPTTSQS